MSQAKVEVEFDEQEIALLEEARGDTDLPTFIREITMLYLDDWDEQAPLEEDEELTPADHIRLAAAAKSDWVSLDEVKQTLDNQMAQLRAKHQGGTAQ